MKLPGEVPVWGRRGLATMHARNIVRYLGILSPEMAREVDERLGALLDI
jgi:hypothetical protein